MIKCYFVCVQNQNVCSNCVMYHKHEGDKAVSGVGLVSLRHIKNNKQIVSYTIN